MIVDLQYGSTGKGLIAGHLAEKNCYDTVINANMPNAGHTYINAEGREWIHKVLPNGIVSPNLKRVMIGPGSVFSVDRLEEEISLSRDLLKGVQILIHPMAVPLKPQHKKAEEHKVRRIGSTGQGSMEATVDKMHRDPFKSVVARDVLKGGLVGRLVVTVAEWNGALAASEKILAEGAQGYSLGINQQFYPFTTSRECTPSRFLSDMGIPHTWLNKVIGTARTFPIRVAGNSGDHYDDQVELSWDEIGQAPELTTVTKKVRRVFSFSVQQMADSIFGCQPDEVFLNFCNYTDRATIDHMVDTIHGLMDQLGTGGHVMYYGHGPKQSDVEDHHVSEPWEWPHDV